MKREGSALKTTSHFAFGLSVLVAAGALSSTGSAVSAPPQKTPLPPGLRGHLLKDPFQPVNRVEELPAAVRDALTALAHTDKLEMANPGQPFQQTDVVMGKHLPFRRLVFGAATNDYCLVAYEHGGLVYYRKAIFFHLTRDGDKSHATPEATAYLPATATTLESLRKAEQKTATTELFVPCGDDEPL